MSTRKAKAFLIRQPDPGPMGLPLEVYAFTKTTAAYARQSRPRSSSTWSLLHRPLACGSSSSLRARTSAFWQRLPDQPTKRRAGLGRAARAVLQFQVRGVHSA